MEPMITPAVAKDFPVNSWGDFLICESAINPSTMAMIPGIGPKHPTTSPRMPIIIDASANP